MKLDIKLLIATLIAGLVAAVLDVILYTALGGVLPGIVLIPLMILILAAVLSVTIMVVTELDNNTDDSFLFLDGKGMIIVGIVISLLILGAVSAVFEWLYERKVEEETQVTSYIFILDESGSMANNDPMCERYSAVNELMSAMNPDVKYAAYAFADECIQIRDMKAISEGSLERPSDVKDRVGELTYIRKALQFVYQDIQSGVIDCGKNPQVILLTDGIANDMSTFFGALSDGKEIVDKYASAGITISTVGLSGNVDHKLMEKIAEATTGSYVRVDNAAQLAQGFSTVTTTDASWDLFSYRSGTTGFVYALMRIVFLTVIGLLLALIRAMATGKTENTGLILLVGAIAALLGALLVEFGTALGLPAGIMAALYLTLVAITPVMMEIVYFNNTTLNINSYADQMYRRK